MTKTTAKTTKKTRKPTVAAPARKSQPADNDEDMFPEYLASVRETFVRRSAGEKLFTTSASQLFPLFISGLAAGKMSIEEVARFRQHYNCNCCRHFIERYGSLVVIDAHGVTRPALWSAEGAPPVFKVATAMLAAAVKDAAITGVFLSEEEILGTPVSGPWTHLSVSNLARFAATPLKNAHQAMASKREDFGMLCRAIADYSTDVVSKAHALLTTGQLDRSEKCIAVAQWFLDLKQSLLGVNNKASIRENIVWRAVGSAPEGFCNIRSSMIGTLLDDVAANMEFASIKRRFDEKIAPTNYMRPTAAPSAGNIAQAEKVIEALKAAGALDRRFALLSDIKEFVWQPPAKKTSTAAPAGVFAHLAPKAPIANLTEIVGQTLTFDKFRRTVLPTASRIELLVPKSSAHYAALVTSVNPSAPKMLQWDRDEGRNPVSWYYSQGVDVEIRERVVAAGGKHEGCDIRASLLWNNRNDLDLHVVSPSGEEISFRNKRGVCGGWLDVDMNVSGETTRPVENIRWDKDTAAKGRYCVYVQNFSFHERVRTPTPFKVEVEIGGDLYVFEATISWNGETQSPSNIVVMEFDYDPAKKVSPLVGAQAATEWNLVPSTWADVTGITMSPNLWGSAPLLQHGQHAFFLLKDCRDMREKTGGGIFVEALRSEYHEIRSTLSAYFAGQRVAGWEKAEACGIGVSDRVKDWNLHLRVTSGDLKVTYTIDRLD